MAGRRRSFNDLVRWVRRRLGVRLRSALAAAVVVALAFAVGAAAFVYLARMDLVGNVDAAARQRAAEVASAVAGGDQAAIAQTLKPSPGEQTLVQILDPSGRVEAASAALGGAAPLSPLRPRPGEVLREQRLLPFADEDPYRVVAEGVAVGSGTTTVLVAQSLRPVNESTEAVAAILIAGLPPMLCCSWSARRCSCSSGGRCTRSRRSVAGSPASPPVTCMPGSRYRPPMTKWRRSRRR
ncbi:hypothetical protein [Micromonospora sp. NPDC007230]|uniref:hypothetical protein n=1 Tax=Micromonospora sp. NPDC007230 TaxID=3364237 RepID=UPI003694F0B6